MKKKRFIFVSLCFFLIAFILFSGCFPAPKRSIERKTREDTKKEARKEVKKETSVEVETQEAKRKEMGKLGFMCNMKKRIHSSQIIDRFRLFSV